MKFHEIRAVGKILYHAEEQTDIKKLPYILEYNPHPNLIHTRFCRFLKEKKVVRGSNPHISFNRPLPTRQTDSFMGDDGEPDE